VSALPSKHYLRETSSSELLWRVVEAVDDPAHAYGIIVHGSWARGDNDGASDIDLLVVLRSGPTVEQVRSILDTQVEIYKGTLSGLRRRLYEDQPLNNNFILNALHEGLICVDRGGWAGALMNEAEVRWTPGPSPMTTAEAEATRRALYRMLGAATRLSKRSSESKQNALIAETRCHQVVIQSFYLYHRVRRKWTTSFPLMLSRLKAENSGLYDLWSQYVDADSQEQRIHVASVLVESVYE
jgi:predicted nucleotidyltransferase